MNRVWIYLPVGRCNICQSKRSGFLLALLSCAVISTMYLMSEVSFFDSYRYVTSRYFYAATKNGEGFLVSNSKCHIISRDALDPTILKFVVRKEFESCTDVPLLTKIIPGTNKTSSILKIDEEAAKSYTEVSCCWAPIHRIPATKNPPRDIDSQITVDPCTTFEDEVVLPANVEVVLVKCKKKKDEGKRNDKKTKKKKKKKYEGRKLEYSNVHPVIALSKVEEKMYPTNVSDERRKLSVLVLGIDTVSRLDFMRTMPKTWKRLMETGWIEMQGYNKMGENTFPNLMAMLTGLNNSEAYAQCTPTTLYSLDNCPFIWYAFRNASYVTAYGEDTTSISTFNYQKVGFVDPPTNYYLRPYISATEKILGKRKRAGNPDYCTGPELVLERIFNYAEDFAKTFIGTPYFGFFWTNSLTHEDINGLSAVDGRLSSMFERLDNEGVLDDAMVLFLSDHGARYGPIRETFQGWYEDRLPFLYVWLPEWFRTRDVEASDAVRTNANRLASPFDLHETLRDVLIRAGGDAAPAPSCPSCQSIFRPIATDRGCDDAGISPHWCACTAFEPGNVHDAIATRGADMFVEHVNDVVRGYRDAKGERLCAPLKLKRIIRIEENTSSVQDTRYGGVPSERIFLCLLQVTPGDGKFEVTIRYKVDGNFSISDEEVSRINVYGNSAKCLTSGNKNYCHCL